jgi:hypothetical protein
MAMDRRQIEKRVRRALDMLFARDGELLQHEAAEWSVAHRLAVYIEAQFPGWHVDCEFNRQGRDGDVKRRASGKGVRPDVIVHHRRRCEIEHNLLAIELKTTASEADRGKAREYTAQPSGSRTFQYQYGLTVVLEGSPALTWFVGGEKC